MTIIGNISFTYFFFFFTVERTKVTYRVCTLLNSIEYNIFLHLFSFSYAKCKPTWVMCLSATNRELFDEYVWRISLQVVSSYKIQYFHLRQLIIISSFYIFYFYFIWPIVFYIRQKELYFLFSRNIIASSLQWHCELLQLWPAYSNKMRKKKRKNM